jgi:hypothetical protein
MIRFHHVNLSIPVDGEEAEAAFLVDYLNYERLELPPGTPQTAKWFATEDGSQIHLSEDPEHHPSTRAHVAIELGSYLSDVRSKFNKSDYEYTTSNFADRSILFCQDPAGNRWELRGKLAD